ncbi:uncharacterized protein BX664DRAFT_330166 [Halteromyces radiatus]|uniref:uncharacterized protein n=1 Tax=Halteromyces radiatus TaxID=101107 RepID=UPI002220DA15|nr:uncharacterized protein BX664DRAFT_330166 [Halteromyces radiatus]KAI8093623.1 hypothetical protein BX664DRAFT_330166 [Halteromyces radiatus]
MLRPLYSNHATKLLLIGPPFSGKRTLAKQLLLSTTLFYSISTLEDADQSSFDMVKNMDYIFIFVDMTNSTSLILLEKTLANMIPEYLLCKCAIVFTKVDMVPNWMLSEDQVHNTIQNYGSPLTFYVNLSDDLMRKKITDQMTRAISIGTFQQRNVHPLGAQFLDSYLPSMNGNENEDIR